jgi:hypothetical protein
MLKVRVKSTGVITLVSEAYFEKYGKETIELFVEPQESVEKLPRINDNPKDIPTHTLKESVEIKKVPMKRKRRITK